jgi:hypothetical protein
VSEIAQRQRLADRLGTTWHISPLAMKVRRLKEKYPSGAIKDEDWLIDLANARGAMVISRVGVSEDLFRAPPENEFSTEELIVAICLSGYEDRLQSLRLAAQLISRDRFDRARLGRLIRQERVEAVLGALAREALHVDPTHDGWRFVHRLCDSKATRTTLLHWTRLAQPIPDDRRVASGVWRLVA